MSEQINFKRAAEQLLEIDMFFTGDLAVKGSLAVANVQIPEQNESPAAITQDEQMTTEQKLQTIAEQIIACGKCQISSTRQNAVPGEGNPKADIVFVGEAPGADEDAQGKPFVGRSGQLLTKIIAAMGLTRENVFICNTLKCRPPENRAPHKCEKESCSEYLKAQLTAINPKVIVALGSHAAHELLESDLPIGKLRGKFHEYRPTAQSEPIKLMPTYHPAYLLRNYSPDNRRKVWEDMQTVMRELGLEPSGK